MASLVDSGKQAGASCSELVSLLRNPMFASLQAVLSSDCRRLAVPLTLLDGDAVTREQREQEEEEEEDSTRLLVAVATLQAELRHLAPDSRVAQLEKFFSTQSAQLVTQRTDAAGGLRALPPAHHRRHLASVQRYYDELQAHLTARVGRSLELLRSMMPEQQLGGATRSGAGRSRMLGTHATRVMRDWFDAHTDHPYPSDEEKRTMAEEGGIALAQVKAWFANKRNRTLNTKPKRQRVRLQRELDSMHAQQCELDSMHAQQRDMDSMHARMLTPDSSEVSLVP